MRLPKLSLLLLVIATGCTNSKTGSGENTEATSVSPSASQAEKIPLTPQELERLRMELFHFLRESEAYVAGDLTYVQRESFILYDEGFTYMATYSAAKDDPNDESDELFVTGDIDSISIDAHFQLVSVTKRPEGDIGSVSLIYKGDKVANEWTTYSQYSYDAKETVEEKQQYYRKDDIPEKTITLNIGEPRIYSRDDMYLKLRITGITEKDVTGYSKDELGYLRNEVFARHGHTFKTPKMIAYFGQQNWYRAYVDDATPFLNDIEKKNIEFIKAKEQG